MQEVYVELWKERSRGILPEVIRVAIANGWDEKVVDLHNEWALSVLSFVWSAMRC